MSNIIPPLLSNSPPPIVGPIEDDDDDDFCDFRAATDLSFGQESSSLSLSPDGSPKLALPSDNLDINSNDSIKNEEVLVINKDDGNCEIKFHDIIDESSSEMPINSFNHIENNLNTIENECVQIKHENSSVKNDIDVLPEESSVEHYAIDKNDCKFDKILNSNCDLNNICGDISEIKDNNIKTNDDNLHINEMLSSNSVEELSEMGEQKDELHDVKFVDDDEEFEEFSNFTAAVNNEVSAIENKMEIYENNLPDTTQTIENVTESTNYQKVFSIEESSPAFQEETAQDFTEFADFSSASNDKPQEITPNDDFDDDFGEFTSTNVEEIRQEPEFDDFGDFSEFSKSESENEQPITLVLNKENAASNTAAILTEIFPEINENTTEFRENEVEKNDKIFNELKDVTETNALLYQWSKSSSQNLLLKALNIDTRNILYGPSWNPNMPKFAANLGSTPLEPTKSESQANFNQPQTTLPNIEPQINNSDIPHVDFDWNGAGLVNPLEEPHGDQLSLPVNSLEFESNDFLPGTNLEPNLVTNLTPNSDKIDDFTEFSQAKPDNEWQNTMPLRETHISNDAKLTSIDLDFLEALALSKNEKENNVVNQLDEFDDFQMVLPEKSIDVPPINQQSDDKIDVLPDIEIEKSLQGEKEIERRAEVIEEKQEDDEFTDFYSSAPPPVLQPTILEPLKPTVLNESTSQKNQSIAWPAPGGISEEDIKKLEITYTRAPTTSSEVHQTQLKTSGIAPKSSDDDEWTDFVSVQQPPSPLHKFTHPDRTSSPDLPLSVLNLSSIQSPKKPIPVITPQGIVQTKLSSNNQQNAMQSFQPHFNSRLNGANQTDDDDWSDFVSSPAVSNGTTTPNNTFKPTTSSNYLNYWPNSQNATDTILKSKRLMNGNVKIAVQSKKNTVPSISSLPDLDFVAPNQLRTNNYRK